VTKPRQREVPLSREDVDTILTHCGTEPLLVGGQALAFWANHYGVAPPPPLAGAVTSDIDFLGLQAHARALARHLPEWQLVIAKMDDHGGQAAKLYKSVEDTVKQVDYLTSVVGLENDSLHARAVTIELDDEVKFRVLHPLDLFESRLQNYRHLPSKRGPQSRAQVAYALGVVSRYLAERIRERDSSRKLLDIAERIIQLAGQKPLLRACIACGIDPLAAIPANRLGAPRFLAERWPRVLAADQRLREAIAVEQARQAAVRMARSSGTRKPKRR